MRHYVTNAAKTACGMEVSRVSPVTGLVEKVDCPFCLSGMRVLLRDLLDEAEAEISRAQKARDAIVDDLCYLIKKENSK